MEVRKSPARTRIGILIGLSGLAFLLAAVRCSQLAGVFEKPELQFRGIRVTSLGIEGASLDLLVDVYNPNSYRLGLGRFSYDLAIENVPWAAGATDAPISVEGRDSATVVLPLTVSWVRLGEAGREALRSGSVNYGVSGEMTVATTLGEVTVPYSKSGRFSVLTGQESSDPIPLRMDPTSRFRQTRYSTETATPFSKTTLLPTLL